MTERYDAVILVEATSRLFARAGLDTAIADAVARILVDADLLGYSTHGLQFVPAYLAAIEAGRTRLRGVPEIVSDSGSVLILDADRLPGQWVMLQTLEQAQQRIANHPTVTVSIRRSGNISCLATYVRLLAQDGLIAVLMASGPTTAAVAPHGAARPLLSTNPIAFAIPSEDTMILADTSTASSSMRAIERARRDGAKLPEGRLIDADGKPAVSPDVVFTDPPGAILPLGGLDQGHKGFAFSLLVEALTSGLSGAGRSSEEAHGNNVFLLVLDPDACSGLHSLKREMAHFANKAHALRPQFPDTPVRLPGERALALYAEQMASGVALHKEIIGLLEPCFTRYELPLPAVITG